MSWNYSTKCYTFACFKSLPFYRDFSRTAFTIPLTIPQGHVPPRIPTTVFSIFNYLDCTSEIPLHISQEHTNWHKIIKNTRHSRGHAPACQRPSVYTRSINSLATLNTINVLLLLLLLFFPILHENLSDETWNLTVDKIHAVVKCWPVQWMIMRL